MVGQSSEKGIVARVKPLRPLGSCMYSCGRGVEALLVRVYGRGCRMLCLSIPGCCYALLSEHLSTCGMVCGTAGVQQACSSGDVIALLLGAVLCISAGQDQQHERMFCVSITR
jgi:hypothetical protein